MKKYPKNYNSFLSLEETLLIRNQLNKYLIDNLIDAFNLIKVESPIFAFKPNIYRTGTESRNRTINFDVSSSNDVLEMFNNFDKWKLNFIYQNPIIFKKYNGLLIETSLINRDIPNLTNAHSYLESNIEVETIIDSANYKLDHFQTYVDKTFRLLKKIQNKLILWTDGKVPRSLNDEYDFYDWTQLKLHNSNLIDEDILITTTKDKGIVFVYNYTSCEIANRFGWEKIPDLNHNELQGSFIVYNNHSKEVYDIASLYLRVDDKTLNDQIEESQNLHLKDNIINALALEKKIPLTLGIKFHKHKLLMFLMQKCHISEVQANIWSEEIETSLKQHGIKSL